MTTSTGVGEAASGAHVACTPRCFFAGAVAGADGTAGTTVRQSAGAVAATAVAVGLPMGQAQQLLMLLLGLEAHQKT